jgi:AraC family transcriptional regulator
MDIELKQMPELRVATVRHVGPYDRIPSAFERLGSLAGPAGLFAQPGAAMIGIYYDDPDTTRADELRSDAAVVVLEGAPLPTGLVERRLAAGRYACTLHVGPYERLGEAWARLKGWLRGGGHRMGPGASYEIYRNDPTRVPKEDLQTELYLPVA